MALNLTKKGERKEIAKLAGLSKKQLKTEKEVIDFLLRLPFEQLKNLYINWKNDNSKQKGSENLNKKKGPKVTEERNQEPNLFVEHE